MTGDSTTSELDVILDAAVAAAPAMGVAPPDERARWLVAVADALDAAAERLIPIAERETAIPAGRLTGEVARTTGQLRLFADVCREGSFLEAMIDNADPGATPPRPEVRRTLMPLGPVAVFAASNFPFAFSVAGGDTASALAAGCPVVVKAHPGHPALSAATAEVVVDALRGAGAPAGAFALAYGTETGRRLVTDPRVRAVGFTGSLAGGRALFDLASARPDPVPFYGELGSLNPVFVTGAAADERAEEIASGFVASYTLGVGQFCTKPGLLFVPAGSPIARLAADHCADVRLGRMLGERIEEGFHTVVARLRAVPGVRTLTPAPSGAEPRPLLLGADVPTLLDHATELLEEAFGPASLVVEYADAGELRAAAGALPASLTAGVFARGDEPELAGLLPLLQDRAGRLVWNGWPTGVAVTWGMHHGGPYPATTAPLHTSVGATAVRRWLRPVAFQNWPQDLLPAALRDGTASPVRIDGVRQG
ncbi:aldehyde dehydrogenase (NADP(+)) [Micromonospora sp. WMMD882]|uniref:aldehyde dehydrogenase (NADP(+)) n=1 Tax=Micromonospora sp. WMMD882 TaxID=3015151 RepID=UPI00248AC609|nr:aldehyde dehydrogenase (NADP(+)) [Micromonospora sp. WMMD882]WBB80332.1 aldehyde dehydrogenase (NADP(+)) [Micromonospora sp. WMMD882]